MKQAGHIISILMANIMTMEALGNGLATKIPTVWKFTSMPEVSDLCCTLNIVQIRN